MFQMVCAIKYEQLEKKPNKKKKQQECINFIKYC